MENQKEKIDTVKCEYRCYKYMCAKEKNGVRSKGIRDNKRRWKRKAKDG